MSAVDLEEGEIADSSGSDDETVLKNVSAKAVEELDSRFQLRAAMPSSDRSYRSTHNPCLDSSNESSSEEEEEFNTSPIKAKRRPVFPTGRNSGDGQSHNVGFSDAAAKFQTTKSRALWNNVVLEQTIGDSIQQVNTIEKDSDDDDRGVESYDYKSKVDVLPEYVKETRETVDYGDDMFGDTPVDAEIEMLDTETDLKPEENICDIESFGSDKLNLPAKHRLGLKVADETVEPNICDMENFGTAPSQSSRKRTIRDRLGAKHNDDRKSAKDRLGTKQYMNNEQTRKATFNFSSKETDPPEEVAMALIEALGEPVYQTEMFHRIVSTVGVKKCIEIFCSTENIEQNGGMLILNGERRRSPGGVFIQLVKSDEATTKEMIKQMFPFQNQPRKKKNKSRRPRKDKAMDTVEEDGGLKELPTRADILLTEVTPVVMEGDATDGLEHDLDISQNNVNIELDFPVG